MATFPFTEQYSRFQQQLFEQWTPFEQFYAIIESSKKLQLPHRYFLSQFLLHVSIEQENNDMFSHTVHQANTPAILACLLSDPLEKILSTLQLYLPLLSVKTTNDKLLDAYRDVLIYLDSKLENLSNISYNEQQLIQSCQHIRYFIENNPSLSKLLHVIPQLTALSTSSINSMHHQSGTDDVNISIIQRSQPALQRYPSGRCYSNPSNPLINIGTENSTNSTSPNIAFAQQLIRKDASDSGVDLTETGMNNSVQNLLSQCLVNRSNLTLPNNQENLSGHSFVSKTTSSPIPEQSLTSNRTTMIPLSAVLSAPVPSLHSFYSDFRSNSSNYGQTQLKAPVTISDEDENENQLSNNYLETNSSRQIDMFLSEINQMEPNKRLVQFRSLRHRNSRPYGQQRANHNESVSPYLAVDSNTESVRNTFIQPNSGMRDVPKWLKNLRLHKYAFFFSQMTYDQMMSLTIEKLKEGKITDGACTKILINIKKLKERGSNLKKLLDDLEHEQIDLKTVLQQLHELMLTPIRAKQIGEQETDDEEDLPQLIMQVLEKVYQRLTANSSSATLQSDMCNNLVGLFDRCYKHEAFSSNQRLTLLQWRGPLCTKLQTSGKIEFKSMQSSSMNRRVLLKGQSSIGNTTSSNPMNKPVVRNVKSNSSYYQNFPMSRQQNGEITNVDGSSSNSVIRRPAKSPTFIFTSNAGEANDDETNQIVQEQNSTNFLNDRSSFVGGNVRNSFQYLTSTPQRSNSSYLSANHHQLLSRKTSIDPYGENSSQDKTKLCKTFSDPSRARTLNSSTQNSKNFPFSSQQSFLSHSAIDQNNHEDDSINGNDSSVFYGKNEINNQTNEVSSNIEQNCSHDQRHNSSDLDNFFRQITASALGDDVHDSSVEAHEQLCDVQPKENSSRSSTDGEQ